MWHVGLGGTAKADKFQSKRGKTSENKKKMSWNFLTSELLIDLFHYTFLKLPNFLLSWQPLIKSHCGSINNPHPTKTTSFCNMLDQLTTCAMPHMPQEKHIYIYIYSKSDEIYVWGLMWLVHLKPRESLIIWEEGSHHRSGSYGMGPKLLTALGPWEIKTRLNNHNSCWKKGEG